MSHVFISYKREDEARVGRIARGLEAALKPDGVEVWWDRGLPGGESWHANIEARLDEAAVVVVVWSRGSVAPEGSYVRDEARRGLERGVLAPVMIDRVRIPLGFGETQAIDLMHWHGSLKDPFFKDLVELVRAKLAGRPAPRPSGPVTRVARRIAIAAGSAAMLGAGSVLAFNLFGSATNICRAHVLQPWLSDACGACGIGGRPTYAERISWQSLRPGVCQDLRAHINRFPNGAFRDEAQALLAARTVTEKETWSPATHSLVLYQPATEDAGSRSAAEAHAMEASRVDAERLCRGFTANGSGRFVRARVRVDSWSCSGSGAETACSFDGWADCDIAERDVVTEEVCGPPGPTKLG